MADWHLWLVAIVAGILIVALIARRNAIRAQASWMEPPPEPCGMCGPLGGTMARHHELCPRHPDFQKPADPVV